MMLLTKAVLVFLSVCGMNCFNISPNPNIIISKDLKENVNKYFGFAINLRKNSILIGAPKATNQQHPNIKETGQIVKCEINELNDTNCSLYEVHANANELFNLALNKSENNEYQMLGSTMDGFGSEKDKFVVCAPNLKNKVIKDPYYHMNGGCFLIENSENSTPDVTNIMLTREKINQMYDEGNITHANHQYAQQGFSVHVTENSGEILMGAPGILNFAGTLMFSDN